MIKCELTNKELNEQYTVQLTSGERIDLELHHKIMMHVGSYFFNLETAQTVYKRMQEHEQALKTYVRLLKTIYTESKQFKDRIETESKKVEEKAIKQYNTCLAGVSLEQSKNLLEEETQILKKEHNISKVNPYHLQFKEISKSINFLCPNLVTL